MKQLKSIVKIILDVLVSPFVFLIGLWNRFVMKKGIQFFPVSRSIYMKVGVLPVIDQYYYPMINPAKHLRYSLRKDRPLPGIDLNTEGQLQMLQQFRFGSELETFPFGRQNKPGVFYYDNGMFGPGDAEILYSMVRHFKPSMIIEIGSGNSTLVSLKATAANKKEDHRYDCNITCVEPYEIPWLEDLDVKLNRTRVELLDHDFFQQLRANDILLIDSSHVIRPQGDVLFEFLEILPLLKKGVIIHVHDIFTPKDYPDDWIIDTHKMWNEQYLLEAFLSNNSEFEIIAALNFLFHHHPAQLFSACPVLASHQEFEPRSVWIRKKN